MTVGFYLTGAIPVWTTLMLQSIRTAMPSVRIVQFTDMHSHAVSSVDVQRLPTVPLSLHRAQHFALVEGDWLFLDTDVIVQKNVADVFRDRFDIAVTDRKWSRTPSGDYRAGGQPEYEARFPYNAGVIFSRCQQFWADVVNALWADPVLQNSWVGDQYLLGALAKSYRYDIRVLPGQVYNFPPESACDPDAAQAAILHFKGKQRKPYLLQRVRELVA